MIVDVVGIEARAAVTNRTHVLDVTRRNGTACDVMWIALDKRFAPP
jgi:hypothetical protein